VLSALTAMVGPLRTYRAPLLADGHIDECVQGFRDVEQLAELVRAWRAENAEDAIHTAQSPSADPGEYERTRAWALSAVAWKYATENEQVQRFRRVFLDGLTLEPHQVDEWKKRQPTDSPARMRLWRLAEALAVDVPWTPEQAEAFVLTDRTPFIETVSVSRELTLGALPRARLVLTVDPEVDPREVERVYRQARRVLIRGERSRPLKLRNVKLAGFVVRRPGHSWEQRRAEWVKQNPADAFSGDAKRFRIAASNALRRLTAGPNLVAVLESLGGEVIIADVGASTRRKVVIDAVATKQSRGRTSTIAETSARNRRERPPRTVRLD
jgi:hypothetical protein